MLLADGRLPTGAHTQSAGVWSRRSPHGMRLDRGAGLHAGPAADRHRGGGGGGGRGAARLAGRAGGPRRGDGRGRRGLAGAYAVRRAAGRLGPARPQLPADGGGGLAPARPARGTRPEPGAGRWWSGATAAEAGLSAAEQTARLVGFEDVQTVHRRRAQAGAVRPRAGRRLGGRPPADEVEAMVAPGGRLTGRTRSPRRRPADRGVGPAAPPRARRRLFRA